MSDLRELRRLEPQFYRAPSAHNTQPWLLDYAPERIELRFDPARHLAAGDPTRRDLFLSLGAFVEAVLTVAPALEFVPGVEGDRVGAFVPGEYATRFGAEDLERRRTSRLAYEPGRITEHELAAARAELAPGSRLHELPARDVGELYVAADRALYDSPPVVEELRSWLRLSKRHPRYERDGLTYECLALSRAAAQALAVLLRPRVYRAVRALRLHRSFTAATTSVLAVDGSVLVLEADPDAPEAVLAGGRALLRVWLALAREGLYTHPLSQILDCAATRRGLAARLGVEPEQRLLSVFRAGRSRTPARSHRLC